jgi:MSHA biogenesis protein MshN
MSLINEMLRDLEARRAPSAAPMDRALDGLTAVNVWPNPMARSLPWSLLVAGLVVTAAIALQRTPLTWRSAPLDAIATPAEPAPRTLPLPALSRPTAIGSAPRLAETPVSVLSAPRPTDLSETTPPPQSPPMAADPDSTARASEPNALPSQTRNQLEAARVTAELRAQAHSIEAEDSNAVLEPSVSATPIAKNSAQGSAVTSTVIEQPGSFRRERAPLAAPTVGAVELARAMNLIAGGDSARGLAALRTYVLGHPLEHAARATYARQLLKLERSTEAEAVLRAGLKVAPTHTGFATMLAHLLFDQHQTTAALNVLRRAAPPVAKDPEYHAFMAAIYQQVGGHLAALGIYRALLTVQPQSGSAFLGMGISLAALNQPQEARHAFERAAGDPALSRAVREYATDEARRLEQRP